MSRRLHVERGRIERGCARLEPGELHYLRDVLRLRPGAPLEIFDGEGGLYDAAMPAEGEPIRLSARRPAPAPRAAVWLAFAPPRGDRADWLVQKAVELGVARMLPFEAERSVVRLAGARASSRAERWRRIAADAARQCGRGEVPEVDRPRPLPQILSDPPPHFRLLLLHEGGGDPFAEATDATAAGHLLLVGPEGGFTAEEVASCAAAGARMATLGPRVLRAETAAVAAVALLQHRLGDLG